MDLCATPPWIFDLAAWIALTFCIRARDTIGIETTQKPLFSHLIELVHQLGGEATSIHCPRLIQQSRRIEEQIVPHRTSAQRNLRRLPFRNLAISRNIFVIWRCHLQLVQPSGHTVSTGSKLATKYFQCMFYFSQIAVRYPESIGLH